MKFRNKLIVFVLLVTLALSLLPFYASAAQAEAPEVEYYGYESLKELPNSEALLYAYDQLVLGVENMSARIYVTKTGYALTVKEVETVFDAYKRDYAQHFWLGDSARVGTGYVEPTYLMTASELPAAKRAFEAAVIELLGNVDEINGDFEKELYLHDRLIASVIYDLDEKYMHSAYGALVHGRAVCDGYTEAFQYLLRRAGIEAYSVYGKGGSENHAWNVVLIDGNYYHVDATWNDQKIYKFHSYFNVTTEEIEVDHDIWETEYDLPVCNSKEKNYFTVMGGKISSAAECTVGLVGDALADGNGYASFYFDGSMTASQFTAWLNTNFGQIAQRAGFVGSIKGGITQLGKEVTVIAGNSTMPWITSVTGFSASSTLAVSIGDAEMIEFSVTPAGAKQYNVVYTSSDESVATVNAESGLVIGRKKGTVSITVKVTNEDNQQIATKTCTVTVGCDHAEQRHVAAGTSTCKTRANAEHYICETCGQIFAADEVTELNAVPKLPLADHSFEQIKSDETLISLGTCQKRAVFCESCSVCGEKDESATFEGEFGDHSHGEEWKTDENGHWHECICKDKADAAAHADNDRNGECDVCSCAVAVPSEEEITTVAPGTESTPGVTTETTPSESTEVPEGTTHVDEPQESSAADEETAEPEDENTGAEQTTTQSTEKVTDAAPSKKPNDNNGGSGCGVFNFGAMLVAVALAVSCTFVIKRK